MLGRGRRLTATFVLIAGAAFAAQSVPATASPSGGASDRLRFGACPIPLPTPRHVDCGKLRVPEARGEPGTRTIRVEFAIVRAPAPAPARPDPIVFVMGGPSYPAIDPFSMLAYFDHTPYTAHRDLILVDLRGTRSSRPFLNCPGFDRLDAATWPEGATPAQADAAERACRDHLSRTADLRHYGSVDTALDLRDLRQALGYPQWNVMAFSAGGEPAFQYLRIDPAGIRAIVLDAPITGLSRPDVTPWWWVEVPSRLTGQLFRQCAAQPSCAHTFPNLKNRFWQEVDALNAHPHLVRLKVAGGGSIPLRVSGYFFQQDVAGMLGDTGGLPLAAAFLDDLLRNGIDPLYDFTIERPFPIAGVFAEGRTIAYRCREFWAFQNRQTIGMAEARYPRWARVALAEFRGAHHECAVWKVGRDPALTGFVDSAVPALVFDGEWDPAVPNTAIAAAARHLHDSTFVQVPAIGHGSLASYGGWQACPRSVAAAFLRDPTAPVDTSCVAHMPHVVFQTSLPSAGDRMAAYLRGVHRRVLDRWRHAVTGPGSVPSR